MDKKNFLNVQRSSDAIIKEGGINKKKLKKKKAFVRFLKHSINKNERNLK